MTYGIDLAEMVDVDRVFLDHENPRHEPYESQDEVIEYLCSDEYVLELARDIATHGVSPLELFALIPLSTGRRKSYVVAEGNRRMCALKLLNDPDLAPPKKRKEFEKLASKWSPIPKIFAVVFEDKEEVDLWIDRIHGGLQGGIGRKTWNAEQKTRHSGDRKNLLAQTVLDYAEKEGMISSDERKGKLTTAQRYLGNTLIRESLGIDSNNIENVCINRNRDDFHLLLEKFVKDLVKGTVSSRSKKVQIDQYSRELSATKGQTGERTEPASLQDTSSTTKRTRRKKPKIPSDVKKIHYSQQLHDALVNIPSVKLERIYYSLCDIDLARHTSLLSVGAWSFMESLTACEGRNEKTDFYSYLSMHKLQSFSLGNKSQLNAIRQAIKRIQEFGNTTKHHKSAAAFNGPQLANDFETIETLLIKLADSATG